jgi:hypothetical protein
METRVLHSKREGWDVIMGGESGIAFALQLQQQKEKKTREGKE